METTRVAWIPAFAAERRSYDTDMQNTLGYKSAPRMGRKCSGGMTETVTVRDGSVPRALPSRQLGGQSVGRAVHGLLDMCRRLL